MNQQDALQYHDADKKIGQTLINNKIANILKTKSQHHYITKRQEKKKMFCKCHNTGEKGMNNNQ